MKVFSVLIAVMLLSACEYVPRKVFEVKTVDGSVIKLACPVIDAGRSTITYLIDGDCTVYQ